MISTRHKEQLQRGESPTGAPAVPDSQSGKELTSKSGCQVV